MLPTIPGLVQDNTIVIYRQMNGSARYRMSMVSIEWYTFCHKNLSRITSERDMETAMIDCDILSILNRINLNTGTTRSLLNDIIRYICKYDNLEILQILVKKTFINANIVLYGASKFGRMEMVHLLITFGANDWEDGLWGACAGGNMQLVQFFIDKGARNYAARLNTACYYDQVDIANFLIKKGANDWDDALCHACENGSINTARLMIDRGATYLNDALELACMNNKHEMVQFIISCGASNCNCGNSIQQHLLDAAVALQPPPLVDI